VPMPTVLSGHLEALYGRSGGDGLVFGQDKPFDPRSVAKRAKTEWEGSQARRLTLHECRRTYASFMIAAGANAKALSTYLGHANIAINDGPLRHLMPGNEAEAAEMLDAFLSRA